MAAPNYSDHLVGKSTVEAVETRYSSRDNWFEVTVFRIDADGNTWNNFYMTKGNSRIMRRGRAMQDALLVRSEAQS